MPSATRYGFFGYFNASKQNQVLLKMIRILAGRACMGCRYPERKALQKQLQVHRIISGRKGGLYQLDNVRVLCRSCHSKEEGKVQNESLLSFLTRTGIAGETRQELQRLLAKELRKDPYLFFSKTDRKAQQKTVKAVKEKSKPVKVFRVSEIVQQLNLAAEQINQQINQTNDQGFN